MKNLRLVALAALAWQAALASCSSSSKTPLRSDGDADASADAEEPGDATPDVVEAGDASFGALVDDFRSGTRLRARVLEGGGDARLFVGWRDAELGADCDFRPVQAGAPGDDGRWRCLPSAPPLRVTQDDPDSIVYLDAGCTQAVRLDQPGKGTSKYVAMTPADWVPPTCATSFDRPVTMFERGQTLKPAPETPLYEIRLRGGCRPMNRTAGAFDLSAIGPKVSVELFVGATEKIEPRSQRMASRVRLADDGARQTLGAYDLERDAACSANKANAPLDTVCLPESALRLDLHDSTCAHRIAQNFAAECPPATVEIADDLGPGCAFTSALFAVGAAVAPPVAYLTSNNVCDPAAAAPAARYVAQGAPIPATAFPALGRQAFGAGPLRRACAVPADGSAPLFCDGLADATWGVCAQLIPFCDGSTRCVGRDVGMATGGMFGDAACKKPLLGITPNLCPPQRTPSLVRDAEQLNASCQPGNLWRPVGLHTGPVFITVYNANGLVCVPAPVTYPYDFHDLEPAGTAASTFASVITRIE